MSGAYMGTQQQLVSKRPIDQRVSYSATSYLDYRLDVNRDMPPGAYYEWLGGNSNARTRRLASRTAFFSSMRPSANCSDSGGWLRQ